ncbi:MAG: Ig-like domain-containing protein, partial [Undibacterium sp.]|nr:Ig-like domain-containing protein [Undibacterium sp.]
MFYSSVATQSTVQTSANLTLLTITPDNNHGRVGIASNIVLTFSEAIVKGTGSITIVDNNGLIVLQESINSVSVSISGAVLTLDPSLDFNYATSYTVRLSEGLVKSLSGSVFMGNYYSGSFQTEYSPVAVQLTGTSSSDTLYGSDLNDVLSGMDGSDYLYGLGGDDILNGGDEVYSGDSLYGGDGKDILHGNAGSDYLYGDKGNDQLFGDAGDDNLNGGEGDDILEGGAGNDNLTDQLGSNVLRGGDGDDNFQSGWYSADTYNLMDGGAGNDYFSAIENDTVLGGEGNDTVDMNVRGSKVQMGKVNGGAGNDLIRVHFSLETKGSVTATGGTGVDTYTLDRSYGTTNLDYTISDFTVGAGGDLFDLSNLLDDLVGNPFAASGNLRLVQDGADTLLRMHDANSTIYRTIVRLTGVVANQLTAENFIGGINPNGDPKGFTLTGGDGVDVLIGNRMNDTLYGKGGSDRLEGKSGDDILVGGDESSGDGADYLDGGDGNDLLQGGAGNDTLYGGLGDDRLEGGSGDDQLSDYNGKNILFGGAGNDSLNSSSSDGSNLDGGDGDDVIRGGAGSDTLLGGAGNDEIFVDIASY